MLRFDGLSMEYQEKIALLLSELHAAEQARNQYKAERDQVIEKLLNLALAATALRVHLENTNRITDACYYDALCDALDSLNGFFTLPK